MANRLALSACALLLLPGAAAAKPGIAASTVNLRAEANTTSAVVTKIPGGPASTSAIAMTAGAP